MKSKKSPHLLIMILAVLSIMLLSNCKSGNKQQSFIRINADSLIAHPDLYTGKAIEIEGVALHICGVDHKKLKLKTKNGRIIKLIPGDTSVHFNNTFYKKNLIVQGIASELRIPKAYIDSMAEAGTLLCHIDHTPCKDSAWVNDKIIKGKAKGISERDIEKLRQQLGDKNELSLICIEVSHIAVAEVSYEKAITETVGN